MVSLLMGIITQNSDILPPLPGTLMGSGHTAVDTPVPALMRETKRLGIEEM